MSTWSPLRSRARAATPLCAARLVPRATPQVQRISAAFRRYGLAECDYVRDPRVAYAARMATPKPADVDAYLAAQPPKVRKVLVKVRAAMRRALPRSVEAIKYGMPAYLVDGRAVASFAGWKSHYALYIVPPVLFEEIASELADREASKGIIRFDLDEPVPNSVLARLAKWKATNRVAAKDQKKSTRPASPAPKQRKPRTAATKRPATRVRRRKG